MSFHTPKLKSNIVLNVNIKWNHHIRDKGKRQLGNMAHSIPPNLDVRTLILKNKTLLQPCNRNRRHKMHRRSVSK
jgi:hypothetical protein